MGELQWTLRVHSDPELKVPFVNFLGKPRPIYHMRAIITRGLYIFYPLFEGQKRFFKEFFSVNFAIMYGG